ncbi:extracellular solute-binding protein [Kineosporia succinea]|uniref:Raffinose/stachyose/melibiose transport system substrate-binding protein n=1 Tax=Kineosporia succinea TaxID=84632 RepID=A0ABT9P641_9ACTN|nr:extracellular solute-binding protein [Kineosporia succinea]MDP9828153.1 raffinose/stachyose/melibiose transport system substrate-binding protein [Kineosporia succinea]
MKTSRRNFLTFALGVPIAGATLAACGSSGPGTENGGGGKGSGGTYWYLSVDPNETIRRNSLDRFNKAKPDEAIKGNAFQNDAYKEKIRVAIGAGNAPTVIWGWGGGGLASWVEAGAVEDLTSWFDENPDQKERRFASALAPAMVDGKFYAVPAESVTPIVLFWNKKVFADAGLQPPTSWEDMLALVPQFVDKDITPFALAGQSRWTNMMWLEFLFDRIGGPEVFQAIFEKKPDAWSDPAAIKAMTELQKLVKAGGFGKGFASITADTNADQALLTSGRAAMMLHGAWTYGSMKEEGGDFVKNGDLGYMNFPPVAGGTGDPSNTYGNPGQYYSLSSKATDEQKKAAKDFFSTQVLSDAEQSDWVNMAGQVPIVVGVDAKFKGLEDEAWLQFVYDTASKAKVFSQSWDQALGPVAAEPMLANIAKLFGLAITPEQFAQSMNKELAK